MYQSVLLVAEKTRQLWQIQADKDIIKGIWQVTEFPEQPENQHWRLCAQAQAQIHSGPGPVRNPTVDTTGNTLRSSQLWLRPLPPVYHCCPKSLCKAVTITLTRTDSTQVLRVIRQATCLCSLAVRLGAGQGVGGSLCHWLSLEWGVGGGHGSCLIR